MTLLQDVTCFECLIYNSFCTVGCGLTVGALCYGLASFLRGDGRMQQYMMRARVVAQGSTVGAVILGLGLATYKEMQAKKQKKIADKWVRVTI